ELRHLVQPRLDAPEVVLVQPVAGERLRGGELHSLRAIVDELLAGPACRGDAPAQIVDPFLRKLDAERPDGGLGGGGAHGTTSRSRETPISDPTPDCAAEQPLDSGPLPSPGPVCGNEAPMTCQAISGSWACSSR